MLGPMPVNGETTIGSGCSPDLDRVTSKPLISETNSSYKNYAANSGAWRNKYTWINRTASSCTDENKHRGAADHLYAPLRSGSLAHWRGAWNRYYRTMHCTKRSHKKRTILFDFVLIGRMNYWRHSDNEVRQNVVLCQGWRDPKLTNWESPRRVWSTTPALTWTTNGELSLIVMVWNNAGRNSERCRRDTVQ